MIASRRLYVLLALGIVPLLLTWWLPPLRIWGLLYDALLIVLVIADWHRTQPPKYITAVRTVADRLSIGRENEVVLTVYNQGAKSLSCRLRDDFPPAIEASTSEFEFALPASAKVTLEYTLLPRQRGRYEFGKINIRYLSCWRLFWRTAKLEAGQAVRVFNDLRALRELSVKLSSSLELGDVHQRRRGHGTDFASLKEYTVGDDSRSIDWKATARRDRPVIRTYEVEQEQNLVILVDAGRMMVSDLEGLSRFDHGLNAALSLALAGLARNDQVALGVFADKPILYLPSRRGKAQLKRLLEAIFDLKPRMIEPDYAGVLAYFASQQKGRSLMVVITDLTDPSGSQTLLSGLASLSPRHLPFCVTLKDRQIERVAADRTAKLENVYRRAVATDLIAQRELALSVLVRRGCLVLDCPPQELSEKLVDRYLEIKARGSL